MATTHWFSTFGTNPSLCLYTRDRASYALKTFVTPALLDLCWPLDPTDVRPAQRDSAREGLTMSAQIPRRSEVLRRARSAPRPMLSARRGRAVSERRHAAAPGVAYLEERRDSLEGGGGAA